MNDTLFFTFVPGRVFCGHEVHSSQTRDSNMNVDVMLCRGSTEETVPEPGYRNIARPSEQQRSTVIVDDSGWLP